jgi:bacillithiol system protein YtxJ
MFGWWKRKGSGADNAIPEIDRHTSLDSLLQRDVVMLFKHSAACPVSWAAHAHVSRFHARNPEVPVYLVPVIKQRAVSQQIAERIHVRHESPQIIVLRRGVVISVASHGAITERYLNQILTVA